MLKTRRVNIYIGAENTILKESTRWTAYVLECIIGGEPKTREGFKVRTGTYNAITLQTIIEALGRMHEHCEIHIYCPNIFVLSMFPRLKEWEQEGYRMKTGKMRKNHFEWSEIRRLQKEHLIVPEPGEHTYLGWMDDQIKTRKKEEQG